MSICLVHVTVVHVDVSVVLLRISRVLFDVYRTCEAKELFCESIENLINVRLWKYFWHDPSSEFSIHVCDTVGGYSNIFGFVLLEEVLLDGVELHSRLIDDGLIIEAMPASFMSSDVYGLMKQKIGLKKAS